MVLVLLDAVLELVDRNLVVLNDKVDLELANTVTNRDKLGGTPDKTILLDGTEVGLELLHVGLVVCKGWSVHDIPINSASKLTPRLNVKGDDGLSSSLGLAGLLLGVLGETLFTNTSSLGVLLLVVRAEKVDIIIILLSLLGGLGGVDGKLGGLGAVSGELLGWVTGERGELGLERGDVLVPAVGVGVLGRLRLGLQGLEGLDIGLRRTVALILSVCCCQN